MCLGLVVFVALRLGRRHGSVLALTVLGAFLIRCVTAVVLYLLGVQAGNGGFFFADDERFHDVAAKLAMVWTSGEWALPGDIDYRTSKNPGFYLVTAALYSLIGPNTLALRILVSLAGTLTILPLYRLGNYVGGKRVALTAAITYALLPDQIFWAALQFRDVLVAGLTTTLLVRASDLLQGESTRHLRRPTTALAAVALTFLRLESAAAIVLLAAGTLAWRTAKTGYVKVGPHTVNRISTTIAATFGTLAALVLGGAHVVSRLLPGAAGAPITGTQSLLNFQANSPTGLLSTFQATGIWDLWKLPFAAVLATIIPFPPWAQAGYPGQVLLGWLSIPWYFVAGMAWLGTRRLWHAGTSGRFILAYLALQLGFLAMFLTSFGAERHRVEIVPLLCIAAALSSQSAPKSLAIPALGLALAGGAVAHTILSEAI